MKTKYVPKFKKFVAYAFEEVNAKRFLSPKENFFAIDPVVKFNYIVPLNFKLDR